MHCFSLLHSFLGWTFVGYYSVALAIDSHKDVLALIAAWFVTKHLEQGRCIYRGLVLILHTVWRWSIVRDESLHLAVNTMHWLRRYRVANHLTSSTLFKMSVNGHIVVDHSIATEVLLLFWVGLLVVRIDQRFLYLLELLSISTIRAHSRAAEHSMGWTTLSVSDQLVAFVLRGVCHCSQKVHISRLLLHIVAAIIAVVALVVVWHAQKLF